MARNPIKASAFTTWLSWLQPFCPIVGRQQWKEQYVTLFSGKPNIFHILLLFYRLQNIPYLRAYDQIWAQKIENNLQRVLCVIVFNIPWERSNAKTGQAADQREGQNLP